LVAIDISAAIAVAELNARQAVPRKSFFICRPQGPGFEKHDWNLGADSGFKSVKRPSIGGCGGSQHNNKIVKPISVDTALDVTRRTIACTGTRIALLAMTEDAREGLKAFAEKRKPSWPGR
jgi:hypothetical protein